MILKEGALLQGGKYRIEKSIGQGGFGITYLAVQAGLEREVAVKEFFLKRHCNRDEDTQHVHTAPTSGEVVAKYRRKFIKEAQTIAALNHPNVVKIIDVFEENDTAYYVMERLEPGELSTMIPSGGLPEEVALKYIRQIGSALSYVHEKKILHLDVKPSNVMFRSTGEAVLIDFGVSKRYDTAGGQTSSTPTGVSAGYAPIEQLRQDLKSFTPATDVYALAATLYKLVTGNTPPDTSLIAEEGDSWLPTNVSAGVRNAIKSGMAIRRKDRPQSVEEFLELLEPKSEETMLTLDMKSVASQNISEESDETSLGENMRQAPRRPSSYQKPAKAQSLPKPAKGGGTKTLLITIIVFLVFMVIGAAVVLMSGKDGGNATNGATTEIIGFYDYPMVYVKGGEFAMGVNDKKYKNPPKKVNVEDYYIGRYEVSEGLWEAVTGAKKQPDKSDDYPVHGVTYKEACDFIRKLNEMTSKTFSLPTEEQWEYAASGGCNDKNDSYATSDGEIEGVVYLQDHPIKVNNTKCINPLGLYHMSGNVAEFCLDNGTRDHVIRGGSYASEDDYCVHVAFREMCDSYAKMPDVGFRLVYNISK